MKEIYLDTAATMPVSPFCIEEMKELYQTDFANPSSLHRKGYEVEKKITKSREQFAKILGVSASEIFFTSGGTESNNMAILGVARANLQRGGHIITVATEHPSVLEPVRQLEKEGFTVSYLGVDRQGKISLEELSAALLPETVLVSVMTVNNETGVIQDISAIVDTVKKYHPKIYCHSDMVQAFGKIPHSFAGKLDLISIAAHKIGAPKGIGILVIKKGTKIQPLFFGGKHQSGLRPGTENYPSVKGFEMVASQVMENLPLHYQKAQELRQFFLDELKRREVVYCLHGEGQELSPYIINIGFPDIRGEVLLHSLEEEGIYIGTGSACQSKKKNISHVLEAMKAEYAEGSIRISLNYDTGEEELRIAAEKMAERITVLRRFVRK